MNDRWKDIATEAVGNRLLDLDLTSESGEEIGRGANQRMEELAGVLRFLAARVPNRILEIGVDRGATLWAWSHLLHHGDQLVGLDIDYSHIYGPNLSGIKERPLDFDLIEGDSMKTETVSRVAARLTGPVDFLFIDGDHSRESIVSDYVNYKQFVAADGVIGFHDTYVAGKEGWEDVLALQEDALAVEFTRRDSSIAKFGIGLLIYGTERRTNC